MQYEIGKKYEVTCAELRWKGDGLLFYIPVFDHLHADPQFGFPHEHYHIDGRFEIHPRMRHWFKVSDGHTLTVIVTHNNGSYNFLKLVKRRLLLERQNTGLLFSTEPPEAGSENLINYHAWYQSFVGRSCKGKRCPHFGTEMLERNGRLVCPMHHLTADAVNQVIIPEGER
jgi:hypothetical protein